jgi:DNA-directed RNA polymerase subunit RPC12/RpoP
MIRFRCTCKHPFETDDNMAGGLVQCPKCGRLNDIPTLSDLQFIAEDGTYKVGIEAVDAAAEARRLSELERAFSRTRVDEYGAEIDLRPTMEDIRNAGSDEIPLELKDEIRPGAPKYDPVTGELIRSMEIRTPTAAEAAVPAMPIASRTLKYGELPGKLGPAGVARDVHADVAHVRLKLRVGVFAAELFLELPVRLLPDLDFLLLVDRAAGEDDEQEQRGHDARDSYGRHGEILTEGVWAKHPRAALRYAPGRSAAQPGDACFHVSVVSLRSVYCTSCSSRGDRARPACV